MGSPCSPSLATIGIHPLELAFLKKAKNIIAFYRYLDDILLISSGSREDVEQNIKDLNQLHPSLQFTAEISDTGIDFLDIHIYKGNSFHETGKLDTRIFTKPCDTFQYIPDSSAHPSSIFTGFIFGEFLRYVRISSTIEEYLKQCNLFKQDS